MQNMRTILNTLRRRQEPRAKTSLADPRPVKRAPEPMPRMRWY
jgi:hypothetical protein